MNKHNINKLYFTLCSGILAGLLAASPALAEGTAPQAAQQEKHDGLREELKQDRAAVKADRQALRKDREKLKQDRSKLAANRKEHRAKRKKQREEKHESAPAGQGGGENK